MAFPIKKPYIGPAPILDQPPLATDWGQLVRQIGPVDTIITGQTVPVNVIIGGGGVIIVGFEQPSLSTVTKVPLSLVTVTLQAANIKRRDLTVFNDSTQPLYLKIGGAAGLDDYTVKLFMNSYWEAPFPATTQIITGIWGIAGTGSARVTEMTVP